MARRSEPTSTDVDRLIAEINRTLGDPTTWTEWPGGWPGDIEAALVDAVFSARSVYRSKRGHGVYNRVSAWRESRRRKAFSLRALVEEIDKFGVEDWAKRFGSRQTSPGRKDRDPGGPTKAATVRQAAECLVEYGFNVAADIDRHRNDEVKKLLRSVPGVGYATTNYFLMLLGASGVKPDRMIRRYLERALGKEVTNGNADQIVVCVAARLGVQPHVLDHAIWSWERARSDVTA